MQSIIFDLDGTLVDSLPGIHLGFDAVCDALGLPRADRAAAQSFVGAGVPVAMERLLAWAGADPALQGRAVEVMLDAYGRVPASANTPYPGMEAALAEIAAQGLRLGLCTNKPEAPTVKLIRALGLGPFDVVIAGDSLAKRKPDPLPLLTCLKQMGVSAQDALYVGDSEVDHATAAAAGVRFVLFEGGYLNAPLGTPVPFATFSDWADFVKLVHNTL